MPDTPAAMITVSYPDPPYAVKPLSPAWKTSSTPKYTLALDAVPVAGVVPKLAEQLAVVPPFVPAHVQYHGPVPVGVDAVPTMQKPVVGMLEKVAPLLIPQVPLVEVAVSHCP